MAKEWRSAAVAVDPRRRVSITAFNAAYHWRLWVSCIRRIRLPSAPLPRAVLPLPSTLGRPSCWTSARSTRVRLLHLRYARAQWFHLHTSLFYWRRPAHGRPAERGARRVKARWTEPSSSPPASGCPSCGPTFRSCRRPAASAHDGDGNLGWCVVIDYLAHRGGNDASRRPRSPRRTST